MERAGGEYGKRKNPITKIHVILTELFYNLASYRSTTFGGANIFFFPPKEDLLISDILLVTGLARLDITVTVYINAFLN